ncbi:MAG: hypothetical protein ACJATI_001240 [Halioglobus sp.]|jgi:hypothetical protein
MQRITDLLNAMNGEIISNISAFYSQCFLRKIPKLMSFLRIDLRIAKSTNCFDLYSDAVNIIGRLSDSVNET